MYGSPEITRWWRAVERGTAPNALAYTGILEYLETSGPRVLGEIAQAIGRDSLDTAMMLSKLYRAGLVETVPNMWPMPHYRVKR